MSLHMISRANEHYRQGTWYECTDIGCREVDVETVENHLKVVREKGFVIPKSLIQPYITSPIRGGVNRHGVLHKAETR